MAELERGGERLRLLPERAVFIAQRRMLLVADVHLGKAQSFRKLGVPVPAGTTEATLGRLSALVRSSGAEQLVFLGDFLHSAHAQVPRLWQALAGWRARHGQLACTLVRGNHDLRASDPPAALGLDVVSEPWLLGGLALGHHPQPHVGGHYVLAGHLHPCVHLHGRARQHLRLPCFHFGAQVGVLPAFGEFTGMHAVQPQPGDALFVVAGDQVRAWSPT